MQDNSQTAVDQTIREIARRLGITNGQAQKRYWLDPFIFSINYLNANSTQLAASSNRTGNFITQNDSAFVICKTAYVATDTSNAAIASVQPFGSGASSTTFTPITITINDSGSGRSYMDTPVPIDTVFGTAQLPFVWPIPKVVDPASSVQATLTNLSATAMNVRLAFIGYKVFGDIAAWAAYSK